MVRFGAESYTSAAHAQDLVQSEQVKLEFRKGIPVVCAANFGRSPNFSFGSGSGIGTIPEVPSGTSGWIGSAISQNCGPTPVFGNPKTLA